MIEDIAGLHTKLDGLPLGEVRQLLNAGVHVEYPGAGEHSLLERADFSGTGVKEGLSAERLRSIGGDRAAILSDDGLVGIVGAITRHAETDDLVELGFGQRRDGSVAKGAGRPIKSTAAGDQRKR